VFDEKKKKHRNKNKKSFVLRDAGAARAVATGRAGRGERNNKKGISVSGRSISGEWRFQKYRTNKHVHQ